MKKLACFIMFILIGCAGPSSQISRMDSSQLKSVPDQQLLRAIKSPSARNLTLLTEAKRRGWLTDREINLINNEKIGIGMSEQALIYSWGKPHKINKSVGSYGTHKQYVYGCYSQYSRPTYVYVKNGSVTGWQN